MAVVRLVVQICGQLCPDLQRKHGVNAALAASFNPEYQQTLASWKWSVSWQALPMSADSNRSSAGCCQPCARCGLSGWALQNRLISQYLI